MTIEELNFRTEALFARGRNIIYYRKIDMNIPRPRVTYIHVLRRFRQDLLDLIREMDEKNPYYEFFKKIIDLIGPKIVSKECMRVIVELEKLYEQRKEEGEIL